MNERVTSEGMAFDTLRYFEDHIVGCYAECLSFIIERVLAARKLGPLPRTIV